MRKVSKTRPLCLLALSVFATSACDDEPTAAPKRPISARGAAATSAKPAAATPDGARKPLGPVVYRDDDFLESDRNRDPFRAPGVTAERAQVAESNQRRVVMPDTPIEAMRLVAIITGTDRPRAMILDPTDVGHVVERGMFIGRPQVVQAAGNVTMTLNWRVDRIRDNEVVLSRQDPMDPTRAPLTRVVPLHEEIAQR